MFYFIGAAVCVFTARDIAQLFLAAAGLLAAAFFLAGGRVTRTALKWLLPIGALIILFNPLFNHRGRTVLFYLFGNSITLEAVWLGAEQALLLSGLVLLFVSFNKVIEPPEFLYLAGKRMPRTALLLNLALQAGARLTKRAGDLTEVQKTKDDTPEQLKSFRAKTRYALTLFNAFISRGLEEDK